MPPRDKKHYLFVCVILLVIMNIWLLLLDMRSREKVLTFAMLDIGQGDALYIQSPTGTEILVDAGPVQKIMGPLMKERSPFDKSIDAVIITNPDADHIGGFEEVLQNYNVGMVLEPGTWNDSKTFQNLKQEIEKQKIPDMLAKRGTRLDIGGGAYIDILFPDRDVSLWNSNDGSIVARLSYGDTSVMLTGDATALTEKIILAENAPTQLQSDILKAGHHGSRTSTSSGFVKALSPAYALISDGRDNKYGHPHRETLDTLEKAGAKVLRTDLLSTIVMKSDGKNETFSFIK